MVEDLKKTKDLFLQHMERLIESRGIERIDAKLLGEYADIIKDLAEAEEKCWKAEYYKAVTAGMQGTKPSQAMPEQQGDPVEVVRKLMSEKDQRTRAQLRDELSSLIGM